MKKWKKWLRMMIEVGGRGLEEERVEFRDYGVERRIDGGVVRWSGKVMGKKVKKRMDEVDDVVVEVD